MLRYDHHPARQKDALAQRQALLDVLVDYRYLAPASIAANERRDQAMEQAAIAQAQGLELVASRPWTMALRQLRAVLAAYADRWRTRQRLDSTECGAGSPGQREATRFAMDPVSRPARSSEVPQP